MINVLHLSDIHYGWKKPEEDGVILDAFFDDLKNTLPINNIDKNYCIISGDLVDKGSNDYVYKDFFANFIKNSLNIFLLVISLWKLGIMI